MTKIINWEIGYGSIWDWRLVPRERVDAFTEDIDEATARAWLGMELQAAAQSIQNTVHVPLSVGQIAALEDFIYNLGVGNFLSSTLLRRLNMGDYAGAALQFERWTHAGGVVMAGLVRRRQAETNLFTGKTPAADPPTAA
jgi:lysozyme